MLATERKAGYSAQSLEQLHYHQLLGGSLKLDGLVALTLASE